MKLQQRMAHHQWDSSIDPQTVPLFLALQWVRGNSLELMRPVLARHSLSNGDFDVLATLRNAPAPHELTPSQIRHQVVITSGGLTRIMLHLEGRGLVLRSQGSADRRVRPVRLSEDGRVLVEALMQEVVAATRDWLRRSLSAQDVQTLTGLLGRLV